MLTTAIASVLAFVVLMGLMAVGVLVQGKRLRGSCGGNPDSANCGCSPEKRAACSLKHESHEEEEYSVFDSPPVTAETLAKPGEERLVQLRTGRLS